MWREEQVERSDKFDFESLIVMLCVVEEEGVKDMESDDLYKIQDWHDIDEGDFAALSSALADGYPLITGFQYGERLASLQPGEVYMPPNRKTCGHVTVLVGAQQERGVKFFYFLNSWSEKFCSTMSEGDGITGGIGAIRADGIDFAPIQILRFRERRRQEVHHPEYFSL
ncbi:hypothetical protein BS78_01G134100 [Paspalum vaginatum]|nr:hypothetical protein BS78_01G134100 [Paspalum vaginatum]